MFKRQVSTSLRQWVIDSQENQCASCNAFLEETCQVDHIDPLWHGGSNLSSNLQALCPNCHARKSRVEQSCIPRATSDSSKRFCPLCKSLVSKYFIHACPKFSIVDPSTFTLYRDKKGGVQALNKFVFDNGSRPN